MRKLLLVATLLSFAAVACTADEGEVEPTATESAAAPAVHSDQRAHHGKVGSAGHAARLQKKLGLTDEQTRRVEQVLEAESTMEARHAAMKDVLTADQYTELELLMAEHGGKHGAKHGMHGKHGAKHGKHGKLDGAGHAAKLQEKLGLSDDQTAQVEAVFAQSDRQERSAKLEAILTADQLEQYTAFKAHHGGRGCGHGKHGDAKDCPHAK